MLVECEESENGKFWFYRDRNHRIFHREEDQPSIIWRNGDIYYYKNGKLDRKDNPAAIMVDGTQIWYQNGKRHRIGLPAEIRGSGTVLYFINGTAHNPNGPSFIRSKNEIVSGRTLLRAWEHFGKAHNFSGPALEYADGTIEYYVFGRKHNYFGPWTIDPKEGPLYALHGTEISCERFLKLTNGRTEVDISARFSNYDRSAYTRRHIKKVLITFGAIRLIRTLELTSILLGDS